MKPLRVLDMFCGGGGSSYGARKAGAEIVCGIDAWDIASRTYADNFAGALAVNRRLEGEEVFPEVLTRRPIDLILASPECTNHTCARGARPRCETSQMTAWQVIHYAEALKPRWLVIENVVQMRGWAKFKEYEAALSGLGYTITAHVLDASRFGVPQTRRRLFMVCSHRGLVPEIRPVSARPKTVRNLLDAQGVWPETLLRREGRAKATLERADRAIQARGEDEAFLLVYYGSDQSGGWQPLDRPLRTLTTLDRFALVRPTPRGHMMRMLQVPELRRAMGFGDDYKLCVGTRRDKVKLMGNGVCPPVMEAIVQGIQRAEAKHDRPPEQAKVRAVETAVTRSLEVCV